MILREAFFPVDEDIGSDSALLDNVVELLLAAGAELTKSMGCFFLLRHQKRGPLTIWATYLEIVEIPSFVFFSFLGIMKWPSNEKKSSFHSSAGTSGWD